MLQDSTPPAKCTVSVDYPQRFKWSVHMLLWRQEILDNWNAEIGDQYTQGHVEHMTNIAAWNLTENCKIVGVRSNVQNTIKYDSARNITSKML